MARTWKAIAVAAQMTVAVGGLAERAQALTETYLFRDSFAPEEGAGNVLVPVSNAAGTILTGGPDFVNGAFVTETISASACASTPTIRAWSFPVSGGLRHDNATPNVVTGSYAISMLMRYQPMDDEYARLIDFSNSTDDNGIYKLGDGVSFYPVHEFASGSFVADQDVFVTITRDAQSQLVSLYIDGVPSGTYVDTANLYAPSATAVYFLMDNTTGSAAIRETDSGVIAYLQVRDTPMTPTEVAASLAAICTVVSSTPTTLPGCGAVATYESIDCRLDDLVASLGAAQDLGRLKNGLVTAATKARTKKQQAEGFVATGKKKQEKNAMKKAVKALTSFLHKANSHSAKKLIPPATRQLLVDTATPILGDMKLLLGTL